MAGHVTSRYDTFDVTSPCTFAVSSLSNSKSRVVEQHGSTRSTCRARLAQHIRHERDRCDLPLSCNFYRVMICKLFTLLEYTFIWFISFDGTNRICVCKSIKTTKLVQTSTIACSSSASFEQHGLTRSSRRARHVTHVKSYPDVTT